ncbi:MAG: phospho-N-acetylmuramoyl-pentapeptide-transferase [Tidjanibacter sp.]|nr:phospho-N-acetylmuramoyl-pentapeptide-transferase [Tidjanibacter sp.]
MLYSLVEYLNNHFDIPGGGMFQYISFRAVSAIILALLIGICFGDKIIHFLQKKQIGEEIRQLGLEGENAKKGTPTMGGIIILGATLIPILLLGDLSNIYIQLMIIATVWLGLLGFLDDYIKVFRKHKTGLKGKFKVIGQVGLGIIVGSVMCLSQDIVVVEQIPSQQEITTTITADNNYDSNVSLDMLGKKNTKTTIPFLKDNEADYHNLVPVKGQLGDILTWGLYILIAIFIITAVSNGANLTDGLDGLSAGVSAIVVVVLGVLAYLSGNVIYSDYLNIMYIPYSGELTVYATALVGALIAFLWFNCHPAQVFMGDTGSLALGGIIAVFALLIRKELLLPLLCGIFLIEALSVIIQVTYFKYTKKKYGEGRRIFLMSPIHHHYQKKGMPETKIVIRFWIIQILLAAMTLVTLKIR